MQEVLESFLRELRLRLGESLPLGSSEKYQMNRKFLGIFHRELLTVSSLSHKNIVPYISANYEPPSCYIVTEFVDGWPLSRLIKL